MNNIAEAHAEDNLIDGLKKKISDLERSNALLKNRYKEDLQAGDKNMFSIDEVVAKLNISRPTFYAWHKQGLAPRLTKLKGTRRQFVSAVDLEKWQKDEKNFDHDALCSVVANKPLQPE